MEIFIHSQRDVNLKGTLQTVSSYAGESHKGDVLGGHRVAQYTGHDPGEQQRTPFFRVLFEAGKR